MGSNDYRIQGMRNQMVQIIEKEGITDRGVLDAMLEVPRHKFIDTAFLEFAYENRAFSIGSGQTISTPFTVAYQTQLLEPKHFEKILEIGTGSGYQASVLSAMGAKVYTIERQKQLFQRTKKILTELRIPRIKLFFGDGFKGVPAYAPYDKIIVTCGAPNIPDSLRQQLKIGGRIVIPLGEDGQRMILIIKKGENSYEEYEMGAFSFVPMLKGKAND